MLLIRDTPHILFSHISIESFIKDKTFIVIFFLFFFHSLTSSSQEIIRNNVKMVKDDHHQMVVHGFLFWVSMGFLIPIGILTIRLSNREERGRRVRIMFFIHAVTQVLSLILVTAGAILSLKNFSNAFNNTHRRIGVVLYGLVFLQALSGLLRPERDAKRRNVWFFAHWVLGTMVSVMGIINIYTGLQAYQRRTSRSIKPWVVFFTAEIVCIGFLYLFQEKWEYIQKQAAVRGNEPMTTIQPTDNREILDKQNKDPC